MSAAAIGRGIAVMADAISFLKMETALAVLFLASCYLPVMQAYTQILQEDSLNYYIAAAATMNDPAQAAEASAWYQQYVMDSAAMDQNTGILNQMMDMEQGVVQSLGSAMDQIYGMGENVTYYLRMSERIVAGYFNK